MKKFIVLLTSALATLTIGSQVAFAEMNPFWEGVLQELGKHAVDLIINNLSGRSSGNSSRSYTLTKSEAVDIVKVWLYAKSEIFAPPYDLSLVNQITTGRQRTNLLSSNGSLNWLRRNNAYYVYRDQFIEAVELFATSESGIAKIQVVIYEDRNLYINGKLDRSKSGSDRDSYLYTLRKERDGWKIENTEVVR